MLISLLLYFVYGGPNFDKYPDAKGPYDVGYTLARSKIRGLEIQVFYPINKL
jgi:hypothetical protein